MTRAESTSAARRRRELNRDGGSRRISQAIDAQRRLSARRADSTRTKANPFDPSDPGHEYVAQARPSKTYRCRITTYKGAHMPVEVLTEVSERDPEAVLTEHVPSEMLATTLVSFSSARGRRS
jgi:hypothetical protein